jgi:hypothetical protein
MMVIVSVATLYVGLGVHNIIELAVNIHIPIARIVVMMTARIPKPGSCLDFRACPYILYNRLTVGECNLPV